MSTYMIQSRITGDIYVSDGHGACGPLYSTDTLAPLDDYNLTHGAPEWVADRDGIILREQGEEAPMLTLSIRTDNAAFEDPGDECAKILRAVATKLEDGHRTGVLVDTNGNRVGTWTLTGSTTPTEGENDV